MYEGCASLIHPSSSFLSQDLLWNSKFKEARVKARSEQATNMWSLIRAAEVEVRSPFVSFCFLSVFLCFVFFWRFW